MHPTISKKPFDASLSHARFLYSAPMRLVELTDTSGNVIGTEEIIRAHTQGGLLHRAFSVYVFTPSHDQLLIQKRAAGKFVFPGFWANTCCSHPLPGEELIAAGERRLPEECGLSTRLKLHSTLTYKADDPAGRGTEYEFLSLLIGEADLAAALKPNLEEVEVLEWRTVDELRKDMKANPNVYAPWFHLGLEQILKQS